MVLLLSTRASENLPGEAEVPEIAESLKKAEEGGNAFTFAVLKGSVELL